MNICFTFKVLISYLLTRKIIMQWTGAIQEFTISVKRCILFSVLFKRMQAFRVSPIAAVLLQIKCALVQPFQQEITNYQLHNFILDNTEFHYSEDPLAFCWISVSYCEIKSNIMKLCKCFRYLVPGSRKKTLQHQRVHRWKSLKYAPPLKTPKKSNTKRWN